MPSYGSFLKFRRGSLLPFSRREIKEEGALSRKGICAEKMQRLRGGS